MHPRARTFMYTRHIKGNNFPVLPMHPITGCIWECNLTWGMVLETGNYLKASAGIWKTRGSTDIKKNLVKKRKEEVNGGEYQMKAFVGKVRGVGGIRWAPGFGGCDSSSSSSGPCAPAAHTRAVPICPPVLFSSSLHQGSDLSLHPLSYSAFAKARSFPVWCFLPCVLGLAPTRVVICERPEPAAGRA